MTKLTPSQRLGHLLIQRKTFATHPYLGATPLNLRYGFAAFEFWHESQEQLYIAVCVPDDAHVVNSLLALLNHFENTLLYTKDADPIRWCSALIVPFGKVKTTFPEDLTVFVLSPEYPLLLELGE